VENFDERNGCTAVPPADSPEFTLYSSSVEPRNPHIYWENYKSATIEPVLILFLHLGGRLPSMTKTLTSDVQRNNAERQLFSARRALAHLVEMYDNGHWRLHYKKQEAFANAVREARQAVDQWAEVVNRLDS
jgi:hypothetical protein